MQRRRFLKQTALACAGLVVGSTVLGSVLEACAQPQPTNDTTPYYTLPPLPYGYAALEPHIDAATMEVHYSKHHAGYVQKLNAAVAARPELAKLPLEQLLRQLQPTDMALRNNGGGTWNHTFFWLCLSPRTTTVPAPLQAAFEKGWGSVEAFRKAFSDMAMGLFGSGWVWLLQRPDGSLYLATTPNQDNPHMPASWGVPQGKPLLALDVWEHAYYLKHQNRRAAYIESFWQVVHWDFVNAQLA
jgi:Fe-Mn family superoxide dismutase